MPAFPATLDDFALPPSNSPEDADDPGLVNDSMWNHYDVGHDVFQNHVQNCPSDVNSITSHASPVSEGDNELCDVSSRHCPTEEGRDQYDEGMQDLLKSVEKSLRISISPTQADDCGDDDDHECNDDRESINRLHQDLPAPDDSISTLEQYLAQEWATQPSCSSREHEIDHENLINNGCHDSCNSLEDVVARLDGLIDDDHDHHPLPYVTDPSSDLLNHASQLETFQNGDPPSDARQQMQSHRRDFRAACQIALEGSSSGGAPPNLCLPTKHRLGQPFTDDLIQKTYDVDSICSFPSSLAVAKLGIQWYPQPYAIFNHIDNVHLSIDIPSNTFYQNNSHSQGTHQRRRPLHHVPNYCLGRIQGLIDTFIWVFFPALCSHYTHDDPYLQTCLPKDEYSRWYDQILLPAITAAVQDPNILQYIPKSRHIAQCSSRARQESISTERLKEVNANTDVLGQGSRSNALSYILQHRHLGAIWQGVQSRAAAFPQFAGIRLYMGAKNLKLAYMHADITQTIHDWRNQWNAAVDEEFLDPCSTYIDIGRQYTPRPGSAAETNVLLWRRCCLKRLWRQRQAWSRRYNAIGLADQSPPESSDPLKKPGAAPIRLAEYPWVTMRDAVDMTITPTHKSREVLEGLLYSQFYNLIKIPFDVAKQYPFQNPQLEKMALDPSYLADCEGSTRGSHANQASLKLAYRLSKLRVRASLVPDGTDGVPIPFIYGVRAEDRLSLTLLQRILPHLVSSQTAAQTDHDQASAEREPPFFAIQSRTVARFLHGNINRYCFLFEYIKSQTGPRYSLPETIVMAVALRSLRFTMSGIIAKESVLWRDRWKSTQHTTTRDGQQQDLEVEREGLGLYRTSQDYGFGWWLPGKFDWDSWRFKSDVGDRLIVGNGILRRDYGRQWRVIRDIRDVHVRMWQAQQWAQRYSVRESPINRCIWLEYLYSTVIELFQCDVWRAAEKSFGWKTGSDLTDEAAAQFSVARPPPYCYDVLQRSFHDRRRNISHTRPHLLVGNKVRSSRVWDLVCDLLGFDLLDGHLEQRNGLQSIPYRIAVRRSIELISDVLGHAEACGWFMKLGHLLLLTHWILPWPSNKEFISTTKQSRNRNLNRRLIWVSLIYAATEPRQFQHQRRPTIPTCPIEDEEHCITTRNGLQEALNAIFAERFGPSGWTPDSDLSDPRFHWTPENLLQCTGNIIPINSFKIGRAVKPGGGRGGNYPLAERGRPPVLRLVNRIRGRTLEELGQLFSDLIISAQSESESQGSIDHSRSPVHTSVSVPDLVSDFEVNTTQHDQNVHESVQILHLRAATGPATNGNLVDPTSAISDSTSDSGTVDSSSEWSPPKRLRRAIRRRQ
ncbi:hypothetical protein FOYG_17279 [Fusarium oxysporum NRRL 32931]|uniref:Uncharacterized protein n=1 Tax=Fusarium oxysporum NRRL 32931 TaxID=660029 RepID=W9HF34_FUSOX|nr:hypothetical protein FOYG_17279 [Fusarium oxysporum NRRL 32931]